MASKVGVPLAIDTDGLEVPAATITATHPTRGTALQCPGCGAGLEAVSGYLRHSGAVVEPVFRLKPGARHAMACTFDFHTEPTDLPVSATAAPQNLGSPRIVVPDPEVGSWHRHATFQMLRAVGVLAARFMDLPEATEHLQVQYRDELIEWDDFYFDAYRSAKRLHEQLATLTSTPLVLAGTIDKIQPSRAGTSQAARIRTRYPDNPYQRPVLTAEGTPIIPTVRWNNSVTPPVKAGDHVLPFGTWKLQGKLPQPTLWLGRHGVIHRP